MNKRQRIKQRINKNLSRIDELKEQNLNLFRESFLLSDDEQWFTEEDEVHIITKRPKVSETFHVGRINWHEEFMDMDTGVPIKIKRSKAVRINGEWINH